MSDKLKVVLCWHMHQPQYSEPMGGLYQLPWTYLHAIKDYVDMAWHLENVPDARAVVNFAPTLLEQLADYDDQLKGRFKGTGRLKDPLLIALDSPVQPVHAEERKTLINACLRANEEKLIQPFPHFARLVEMARWTLEEQERLNYVNDQFMIDLLVWYHLVWMAESVRRSDVRIQALMKKGRLFTFHDRRQLMMVMGELLSDLIPRYRRLAESGRVELSVTPYAHPIMPLLLDINSTLEAMPDALLPEITHYPGGRERAHWHLEEGLRVFESFFGFRPKGCWPSEGAVSEETLKVIAQHGFEWAATGENVLRNSLKLSGIADANIHKPYKLPGASPACFYRDDGLSDMIGFIYTKWGADDAVNDFIHHLLNIKKNTEGDADRVVSVILDGENAWEYYSYNGFYFLQSLYRRLTEHPEIELTTFSDCLHSGVQPAKLPKMVGGSWVFGTYSTWIGDPDKNRAWDLLSEAKKTYDRVMASHEFDEETQQALERQLAICEGSDWFWWFGDYNAADSVSDFERLYRLHLSNLYQMLGEEVPQVLSEVISHGGGNMEQAGTMRRGS
ncbi:glycoside hydrolase family 57 protein [Methylophaga sp.]|jgi:alpha-amylase/alpha-mannosidase (GH57 family)|uniref:glycoside hydrolase family 57 protein n=1 Tax=Methylophaga sp. TaxID=2024840 RepID=UPI0013FE9028|nr:glycoside hydrolase family 57 protein [Methylophaga sp.]MTI64473.1 glycoside hydrolase [Methylophaga sp.]